ncbi:uncharacterized protein PAC_18394 [Phialocephala subalpina]|uniref:Methyltransferase type 12 domain-containing protein n=1 Tax=Phialocephala subalpina TaxID=576137 RepID=A0A1L7XU19_9HELO|nr:uncharacterized protein PAC_18394 [Phialocephala subalpina]
MSQTPPPEGLVSGPSALDAVIDLQLKAIHSLGSNIGAHIQHLEAKVEKLGNPSHTSAEASKKRKRATPELPQRILDAILSCGDNLAAQMQDLDAKIDQLVDREMARTRILVTEAYNKRASDYDTASSFHRRLARRYKEYVKPKAGESLLDLACGTGQVAFAMAPHLQLLGAGVQPGRIVGIDISSGMLKVAKQKLQLPEHLGHRIQFLEHDITKLHEVGELKGMEGAFDIITVCSALVLLDDPVEAIRHWATYLKPTGRLVLDVPHPMAMLGVRVLSKIAPQFGVDVLGNREWISGPQSLTDVLESAGLDTKVKETEVWSGVPASTDYVGKLKKESIWTSYEGGPIFETMTKRSSAWECLGENEKRKARWKFEDEFAALASEDGCVKEVNKLFIGVGVKRWSVVPTPRPS